MRTYLNSCISDSEDFGHMGPSGTTLPCTDSGTFLCFLERMAEAVFRDCRTKIRWINGCVSAFLAWSKMNARAMLKYMVPMRFIRWDTLIGPTRRSTWRGHHIIHSVAKTISTRLRNLEKPERERSAKIYLSTLRLPLAPSASGLPEPRW